MWRTPLTTVNMKTTALRLAALSLPVMVGSAFAADTTAQQKPNTEAADVSSGDYAAVYATRLIASRDKDASGAIEKLELAQQSRPLSRWHSNHDDSRHTRDRFGSGILKPGTDPNERLKRYREISPVRHLHNDSPPLLMIQGDKGTTIQWKHAPHMKQKADAAQSPVVVMLIRNAGHNWREAGATIEPGIDEIVQRTVTFLTDRMKTVHEPEPPP